MWKNLFWEYNLWSSFFAHWTVKNLNTKAIIHSGGSQIKLGKRNFFCGIDRIPLTYMYMSRSIHSSSDSRAFISPFIPCRQFLIVGSLFPLLWGCEFNICYRRYFVILCACRYFGVCFVLIRSNIVFVSPIIFLISWLVTLSF